MKSNDNDNARKGVRRCRVARE